MTWLISYNEIIFVILLLFVINNGLLFYQFFAYKLIDMWNDDLPLGRKQYASRTHMMLIFKLTIAVGFGACNHIIGPYWLCLFVFETCSLSRENAKLQLTNQFTEYQLHLLS